MAYRLEIDGAEYYTETGDWSGMNEEMVSRLNRSTQALSERVHPANGDPLTWITNRLAEKYNGIATVPDNFEFEEEDENGAPVIY